MGQEYNETAHEKEVRQESRKKHKQKSKQVTGSFFTKNVLIILLITALIFAVGYPFWVKYTDRITAHWALREAKNVQLSLHLLSSQYYGEGTTPKSTATVSGLKETAEKEVLKLAGAAENGKIHILKWDKDNYEPVSFEYTTGNFLIFYSQSENGENLWTVSKIKEILSFS